MTTLKLKTLLGDYANTQALKNGSVVPKLFEFEFADVKVPNRAFKRVVRNLEFDVAELALVTCLQAKAYGKPLALMPAVVGGAFSAPLSGLQRRAAPRDRGAVAG